jgi:hypothetical protein
MKLSIFIGEFGWINKNLSSNALDGMKRLYENARKEIKRLRRKRPMKISSLGEYDEGHKLESISANLLHREHRMV